MYYIRKIKNRKALILKIMGMELFETFPGVYERNVANSGC
jgi:hypothetical protein